MKKKVTRAAGVKHTGSKTLDNEIEKDSDDLPDDMEVELQVIDDKRDVKPDFEAGEISSREVDATRLYLKEIEFSPLLTPEEEVYYGRLSRKGDDAARCKMIESNLRLVVKISRGYMNRGLALLDLIEEGNLG